PGGNRARIGWPCGPHAPFAQATLRRPGAARSHRPRARHGPETHRRRRAHRQSRFPFRHRSARRVALAQPGIRQNRHHGNARSQSRGFRHPHDSSGERGAFEMTLGTFIIKNALRNKRRATLSILSVAVSLFLLVLLLVALREITLPAESPGAELRVAVRNKISIANLLPARQLPIIERIPGVESVTPFTWFGGKYKNEENMTFAQFAMDPKKLRTVFGEAKMV